MIEYYNAKYLIATAGLPVQQDSVRMRVNWHHIATIKQYWDEFGYPTEEMRIRQAKRVMVTDGR